MVANRLREYAARFLLPEGFARLNQSRYPSTYLVADKVAQLTMITATWVADKINECPLRVVDEDGAPVENHWLTDFIVGKLPLELYDIILEALIFGTGYAEVGRGIGDEPLDVSWLPYQRVNYRRDVGFSLAGTTTSIDETLLMRLILRRDPAAPAIGVSPATAVTAELTADRQASEYVLKVLANRGTPWALVSPERGTKPPTPNQRDKILTGLTNAASEAGIAHYIDYPVNVHLPSVSNALLDVSHVHNVAEERIAAAYHVQPSVLGFGVGLEQTKVGATAFEQRRISWQDGVIPKLHIFATQLARFFGLEHTNRLEFDTSRVPELQTDAAAQAARLNTLVQGGIMTVSDAQADAKLEVDDAAEVYYVPIGREIVPRGELQLSFTQETTDTVNDEEPDADAD